MRSSSSWSRGAPIRRPVAVPAGSLHSSRSLQSIDVLARARRARCRVPARGRCRSTARGARCRHATADAVAKAIGCAPEQIVKSLVFVCDTQSVLALVPGDRRADPAKVASAAGAAQARVARPAEVVAATGFPPGAVSPLPPPVGALVLIERTMLSTPCRLGRRGLRAPPGDAVAARARPADAR